MADTMTTALYIIVLAAWFFLMCVILRCCSDGEPQTLFFDLDPEMNLAVAESHRKPSVTAVVDGEPARFARVQVLGAAATAEEGKGGTRHEDLTLDGLEIPAVTGRTAAAGDDLPAAQEVWSPILALRTFVEPLTSRASAAFRNFHVSFFDGQEEVGGVVTGGASGDGGMAARAEEERSSVAGTASGGGGAAAPEAVRVASAERCWPAVPGGIEFADVSNEHERAAAAERERAAGEGEEEVKVADTGEMSSDGDLQDSHRVAV
ncbi:hypothetical protein Esi_0070_0108 [Ectocarpus siliculosus]|uniref:Uncharacterized protein n=1 Tax=Ectocarpus siliculosus TaxID=2880 RepID=D8LS93_ECTSI|nr:hypothetical protein Esi_0070_0108 [Ectocarpus siliculosus]|eukprot:CBN75150.1 hypothetical protein Esi_0070_0108 [Ectocarpus siliculosus]